MSGGAWYYLDAKLESAADMVATSLEVLGAIEHELDWGVCGDTCLACAELRVIAGLKQFFEDGATSTSRALALIRDHNQNRCERCIELYG